jgi:putative transcriptional regulator
MAKKKTDSSGQFRSEAMAALHEAAEDLYKAGGIDKLTMREFDLMCRTPIKEMSPREIQALREETGVSQGVLALALNVRPGLVSQWERGERKPSGPSLKLLSLIKAKGFEAVI